MAEGMKVKWKFDKNGFCNICDFYMKQYDEAHGCESANYALTSLTSLLTKLDTLKEK